jgi:hypothetical protein
MRQPALLAARNKVAKQIVGALDLFRALLSCCNRLA